MRWLVRLYPRWWRHRYGAELADLLCDLAGQPERSRLALVLDTLRGAWDAHTRLEDPMSTSDRPALRLGLLAAIAVWALLSIEIVLSNVVYPSTADDDGPSVIAAYLVVFAALTLLGAWTQARAATPRGPVLAGALAGAVIAVLTIGTYAVIGNVFLTTVSQQQAKIDGLAHSGMATMRGYVNVSLAYALLALTIGLGAAGAGLGAAGAAVGPPGPPA